MRSERKMLPIGVENFEKLRRNDMYYVDKTEIIADLLRNHGDASLITRPRRFGKTLTILIFRLFCKCWGRRKRRSFGKNQMRTAF